jgi:hypothetical protein
MAHPFNKFRQSNVERSRVGEITKQYARGGGVHPDAEQDKKLIKKMIGKDCGEIGGVKAAQRMDRPRRASGGKVKKGTTVVNVITGGQQQPPQPVPVPIPPPAAAMPPGPPPGPPPGALPPGGPMAGPGPGMPPGPPMRARGGSVKGAKSIGMDVGTPVQHDKAKAVDIKNMNRPRVVTFNTGGGVKSFRAYGGGVKGVTFKGGTPGSVAPATKLPGGAGGGLGRLKKAKEY